MPKKVPINKFYYDDLLYEESFIGCGGMKLLLWRAPIGPRAYFIT
jgi:hypothetical protein